MDKLKLTENIWKMLESLITEMYNKNAVIKNLRWLFKFWEYFYNFDNSQYEESVIG